MLGVKQPVNGEAHKLMKNYYEIKIARWVAKVLVIIKCK